MQRGSLWARFKNSSQTMVFSKLIIEEKFERFSRRLEFWEYYSILEWWVNNFVAGVSKNDFDLCSGIFRGNFSESSLNFFSDLDKKTSAGLSKMHTIYPEDQSERKKNWSQFQKVIIFLEVWLKKFRTPGRKFSEGFLKSHSLCPQIFFDGNKIEQRLWILQNFWTLTEIFSDFDQ